jgi:hypothetical protein
MKERYGLFNRGYSLQSVGDRSYTDYKEDQLIILGNLELATCMIGIFIRYKTYEELNKETTYDDYRLLDAKIFKQNSQGTNVPFVSSYPKNHEHTEFLVFKECSHGYNFYPTVFRGDQGKLPQCGQCSDALQSKKIRDFLDIETQTKQVSY